MNFGSVCSGIEAASVAWNPLGWRAQFFSEIEPFPCAVLAHHYPDVPNRGDMTKFKDWPDANLDVLCGGTPCQSFSNAGLRAGLDDPRGQLMLTFGAIAARHRPRWLVWENVPGVLSSNGGRDFGAFLGLLGFLGYGFAYRILDAQFVRVDGHGRAVPQRRNRVFVVGCLGDWRSAAAVLLERESLRGDPAPRRSPGTRVAATLTRGAESSGKGGYAGRRQEDDVNLVAGTINAGMGRRSAEDPERDLLVAGALAGTGLGAGWRIGPDEAAANQLVAYGGGNTQGPINVSTSLTAHGARQDFDTETFVTHALTGEGFDASEDGTGRGTPLVPVGFDTYNQTVTGDVSLTLCSRGDTPGGNSHLVPAVLAFDTTQITSAANRSSPKVGDPCHPLSATAHPPAIAFNARQDPISGPISGPIDTDGSTNAIAFQERGREGGRNLEVGGDVAYALTAPNGGGRTQELNIAHGWAVRRLMPIECERLMAFPDNYTAITFRGKPASDGVRYKALGNSWATNCPRWIGRRIEMVDSIKRSAAA